MKQKVTTFKKKIGTNISGTDLEIFGYKIASKNPGGKLYIQGGIHGGEVTIWIIEKLFNFFTTNDFNGEVIIIPISNPIAWQQRTYFYTVGKFDLYMGKDWNRNFPGNEEGSLGEKIAYALTEEASNSDLVIDLHTSRNSFPFGIAATKEDLDFLKIVGLEYNFFMDLSNSDKLAPYKNTLLGQMGIQRIPNVTIECGSHDSYEPEYVEKVFQGLLRAFSSKGFIKKETTTNTNLTPKYYTKLKTYRIPQGGFAIFKKEIGVPYKKNDILYEIVITNDLNNRIEIKAEEDGIIEKQSPTHIYWPGDDVLEVITNEDINVID